MTTLGIIGAGHIGSQIARAALTAGYDVVIANSRGPETLSDLVARKKIPPKVLVVHRFTQRMVTGYESIEKRPEVQIVMVMDGWGSPARKINTYRSFIQPIVELLV